MKLVEDYFSVNGKSLEFSFWTGVMQDFGFALFFIYHCRKRWAFLLRVSDDTYL